MYVVVVFVVPVLGVVDDAGGLVGLDLLAVDDSSDNNLAQHAILPAPETRSCTGHHT